MSNECFPVVSATADDYQCCFSQNNNTETKSSDSRDELHHVEHFVAQIFASSSPYAILHIMEEQNERKKLSQHGDTTSEDDDSEIVDERDTNENIFDQEDDIDAVQLPFRIHILASG